MFTNNTCATKVLLLLLTQINRCGGGLGSLITYNACATKFDSMLVKEALNSFFGLGVYLLKSKFRIEDKLGFP